MLALLILVKVWYLCGLKIQEEIENFYTFHKKKSSRNNITAIFQDKEENCVFCSKKMKEII